jgi:hypothetical protein
MRPPPYDPVLSVSFSLLLKHQQKNDLAWSGKDTKIYSSKDNAWYWTIPLSDLVSRGAYDAKEDVLTCGVIIHSIKQVSPGPTWVRGISFPLFLSILHCALFRCTMRSRLRQLACERHERRRSQETHTIGEARGLCLLHSVF